MTIYFDPPRPHPRAGEKVKLKKPDGRLIDAEIHWIYGQDKYFLVSAPKHNYHYSGWVMKVTEPEKLAIREYRTKDGRDMLLVNIDQPAVRLWKRIPKQHLTLMNNLTVSKY